MSDRFLMLEARCTGANLAIYKPLVPGTQMSAEVRVDKATPTAVVPTPSGLVQACQMGIALIIEVGDQGDGRGASMVVSASVGGFFGVLSGETVPIAAIEASAHSFARMLYPLARSEVAHLLASARLADVPVSWDIGPNEESEGQSFTRNGKLGR